MECKFCNAPMEDDMSICPVCGKEQTEAVTEEAAVEETVVEETAVEETAVEETVVEETMLEETPAEEGAEETSGCCEDCCCEDELLPEAEPKKKSRTWLWVLVAVVVVALAALAAYFMKQAQEPVFDVTIAGTGSSYTMPETEMTPEIGAIVVADSDKRGILTEVRSLLGADPLGKDGLTNAQLALYYWDTFYSFYNNYYYYMAMMGFDPATMDTAEFAEGQTWQEYFLTQTLNRYRSQLSVYEKGQKEGFELPADVQAQMEAEVAELSAMEDFEQILLTTFGPNVTPEDYFAYWEMQYYYAAYAEAMSKDITYTDEDLDAYYEANADLYAEQGLEKTDEAVVDVRHVLIQPKDAESEAAWADAKAKAEDLYAQWQAGAKDEASFSQMAIENSSDPGSGAEGGLYEGVFPGQMVPAFNDWCFDAARQPGDTGIVETEYGYHIMYFVGKGESSHWKQTVAADYVSEQTTNELMALAQSYTLDYDLDKIAIVTPAQLLEQ